MSADTDQSDAALDFDPFEGDYGDGETRIIDAIVDAPKPVRCHVCHGQIKPDTKVRRIVETRADLEDMPAYGHDTITADDMEKYERQRSEYLICEACCNAARKDAEDGDDRLERRYGIGYDRRNRVEEKATKRSATVV